MDAETFKATLMEKDRPFLSPEERDRIVSLAEQLTPEVRQQVIDAIEEGRSKLKDIGMLPRKD